MQKFSSFGQEKTKTDQNSTNNGCAAASSILSSTIHPNICITPNTFLFVYMYVYLFIILFIYGIYLLF